MVNKNNTGSRNTGSRNTGNRNTGDYNTGNRNTGDWNTGDWNTGYWNAGDWNTGYWNAGNWNTGDWNTGYWNAGDWNAGDWNTGDWNAGFFNRDEPTIVRVFEKDIERSVWDNAEKPKFLYFELTEWIPEANMTDKEKEKNPTFKTTGGYLKKYGYQEAFRTSYEKQEDKESELCLLFNLPNFDVDIFKDISGLDFSKEYANYLSGTNLFESTKEIEKVLDHKIKVVAS